MEMQICRLKYALNLRLSLLSTAISPLAIRPNCFSFQRALVKQLLKNRMAHAVMQTYACMYKVQVVYKISVKVRNISVLSMCQQVDFFNQGHDLIFLFFKATQFSIITFPIHSVKNVIESPTTPRATNLACFFSNILTNGVIHFEYVTG